MNENVFTYKIDTNKYLSLEEFTNAIIAIGREYKVFTKNSAELQIKEIRKGSFEVEFISTALPTLFTVIENSNTVVDFCKHIKDVWNCILSPKSDLNKKEDLTDKSISNCVEISNPIINNSGTVYIISGNNNVSLTTNEAKKINRNKGDVIKSLKSTDDITNKQDLYKKQLFYWHQTCFDEKHPNVGNKGIIEKIQKEAVKVIFEDDNSVTKKEMTTSQDGIDWQKRGYIVDVEVVRRNNKIVLYKIINNYMKDSIVDDIPQLPFN